MPILTIQRRLREAGRIRLGDSVQTTNAAGKKYARPRKLNTFRLTSPDEALLDQAAELYGGTVKPWDGHDGQFDLTTDATVLPCRIPPAAFAFSQWFEHWQGGLCEQRCDGEFDVLRDCACTCDPSEPLCKPVTRLSLLLTDLPGSGAWRLETRGWNAATELSTTVELIQAAGARGVMLPARLLLVQRAGVYRDDKGKPVTRKFVVPALDIDATMFGTGALAGAPTAIGELAAPQPSLTPVPPAQLGVAPSIEEQVAPPPSPPARANAATPIGDRTKAPRPRKASQRAADGPPAAADAPEPAPAPRASKGAAQAKGARPAASADPPPEPDPDATARAQRIAIWCNEAGMSDDERHEFLAAYSSGAYSSGKLVPTDDLAGIRAAVVKLKRGELHVEAGADGPILVNTTTGLIATRAGEA